MPAISDLNRLWSATRGSIGKGRATIAADDLDSGMHLEPVSERLSGSVLKQINWNLTLQIHQNGAIALSLAPSPLVYAYHPHGGGRGQRSPANEAQDGGGTALHRQSLAQPCTSPASHRLTNNA